MPYNDKVEVGLLIGINCTDALRPQTFIRADKQGPYARKTVLGWSIIGQANQDDQEVEEDDPLSVHRVMAQEAVIGKDSKVCYFASRTQVKEVFNPAQVLKMFELDFNDGKNDGQSLSYEDRKFIKLMSEEIHQLPDRHYEMPLPFKDRDIKLPNNKELALHRVIKLKRRMQRDTHYCLDYIEFMNNIIDEGYAEMVPNNEMSLDNGHVWYIPHHGVYHTKKPGKIRVVFDGSASHKGKSLNQCLLQGPDLTNNLAGVLCRFRQEPVAFVCDIEGMFHQVKVNKEHRNFLRFLWWKSGNLQDELTEYRMTVHLFGATSSPSAANFALQATADDHEGKWGSEAADFVRNEFYVDDGLKSVPTVAKAIHLIERAKNLCKEGGFNLHKFISNRKEVLEAINPNERAKSIKDLDLANDTLPIERTLGVQWCVESDTLQFRVQIDERPWTRRGILSTVSSVFDPLGMVSPLILIGKRILQDLCRDGADWDDEVPEAVRPRWEKWRNELHALQDLKIPRCYKPEEFGEVKSAELHHFSDASQDGYGQCSYLRLINEQGQIHCSLVMAKARVTPLKLITIPRLELTAAVVSVKIYTMLRKELKYQDVKNFFWTDSKVVLGYINNEARRFHVFVANRVQQIRNQTLPEQWGYVQTNSNPADSASRGLHVHELISKAIWWDGPEFLRKPLDAYSLPQVVRDISVDDPEVKIVSCATQSQVFSSLVERLEHFSSWHRAKRAAAVCLRLCRKFKDRASNVNIKKSQDKGALKYCPVNVEELQSAETEIVKQVQHEAFEGEIKCLLSLNMSAEALNRHDAKKRNIVMKKTGPLYRLDPFLDEKGILRVGGRIKRANFPNEVKHPAILPSKGHITELVICHYHNVVQHQGRGITLNEIRASGFWIISGSSVVGTHISKCIKCRKLRGATQVQKMADLPKDRLDPAPPFTYCAVDYFGPWYVKEGRRELKRYGVLFTCMASRAIHLETAHSLETDSFLNAYRRFVGRRGPVRQLRSDQGTNFVGAHNELGRALLEMNHEKVRSELLKDKCDWVNFKMNVPYASHMGGVWERQIRTVRSVLSSLLDHHGTQLDDEALRTFMVETEAIVNSRPLTVDNLNSPQGLEPLTPNHLLTMKSKVLLPPPGIFQNTDQYSRKRWRRVQYLANEFWNRWKREYVQSLQLRQKWTRPKRNLQVDDIVIVKDPNLPRNEWKLARVVETVLDDDNHVRKVRLAMADPLLNHEGKPTKSVTYVDRPIHNLVLLVEGNKVLDKGVPDEEPREPSIESM